MTVPSHFGLATAQFQLSGTTHTCVITCGFINADDETAVQAELDWRTALSSASRPFALANIAAGWFFYKTTAIVNIAGVETYAEHVINGAGTKVAAAVPVNSAVLIQKQTGVLGRHNKGRMYVPPFYFLETDVDMAGNIGATPLGAYAALWNSAFTDMQTTGINPYILHSDPLLAPTPVTSFTVSSVLASQRRRMRS